VKNATKALKTIITPFEVKGVNAADRTFEGLAATYDPDLSGDIIHPGAFAKTLTLWKSGAFAVPLIDNHGYRSAIHDVVGSMIEAEETEQGLRAKFEVDEGPDGDKLLRHIERKRINGLSIGYEAVAPERDELGVRHLKEIKLFEVSAVIWPMNPAAQFDTDSVNVKSLFERLDDEQKKELRAFMDAEAAKAAEKTQYPEEKMDALRANLLALRLRPLLATAGH
jgi:HK97 family phage prohead protease